MPSPLLLHPNNAVLFLCDVQERFRPLIFRSGTVIRKCSLLYEVCSMLQIPCIVTEQNSRVFGKTVSDIKLMESNGEVRSNTNIYEKFQFSMLTEDVKQQFDSLNRKQVILCGIEAHVCVQQTALELTGYEVHLACDAVSSQRAYERSVALTRLRSSGVNMSTTESILFELLRTAKHPNFKEISRLIVADNRNNENEFSHDNFL